MVNFLLKVKQNESRKNQLSLHSQREMPPHCSIQQQALLPALRSGPATQGTVTCSVTTSPARRLMLQGTFSSPFPFSVYMKTKQNLPECFQGSGSRSNYMSPIKNTVLLLLLLSHVSRVRLCATPQTAAHQAPPSLGFSRQEHWSGLPFPFPMHESEK